MAQIGRPPGMPPPAPTPAPPAPRTQPLPPRPAIPVGDWIFHSAVQTSESGVYHLRGKAEAQSASMLLRADEIDYDENTQEFHARGNVYFHSYDKNEEVWADRVDYNVEDEKGKFYVVHGTGQARIDSRPGVLTTNNPYYFEGKWAERVGERYILHDGFFTNCRVPRPWWRLRGPRFEIVPGEQAKAYHSTFLIRKFPLFYTPFFYKSLERLPRKSGFLMPNLGNSSTRGKMFGLGYYWAINRSYDATYRFQDFTARGYAHHLELRGKPTAKSDFDAVLYGVQDRGINNDPLTKAGGVSVYVAGKADLGHGFTANGELNYLSSFRFRQAYTETYNEAVGSEVHSVGFINRHWSYFVFNAVFARLENFQSAEIPLTDPVTGSIKFQPNSVVIRKLPDFELSSRDRQVTRRVLPVWFSFDSSAGLVYRSQDVYQGFVLVEKYQTGQFTNRFDFHPRITTALHWKDWHLIPSFAVRETYYGESQTPFQDRFRLLGQNIVRSTRELNVDLIAPALSRTFDKKTFLGDKLKHVIEPRASFQYVTGVDDFDKIVRFDLVDLVSDTEYGEVSVTNRLFAKRKNEVAEVITWQLAQRYYFDPTFGGALLNNQRNVVLSALDLTPYAFLYGPRRFSPLVSAFRVAPRPGFGVEWRVDYDPVRGTIMDSGLTADARFSKYFISVGHNQVNSVPTLTPNANQFRGTIGWGNENRRGWNAGFTAIYDYRLGVMQYGVTQVTYNTDCCGISVQYRRFSFGFRNENQFRLAFAVANIGSFGTLKKQERLF